MSLSRDARPRLASSSHISATCPIERPVRSASFSRAERVSPVIRVVIAEPFPPRGPIVVALGGLPLGARFRSSIEIHLDPLMRNRVSSCQSRRQVAEAQLTRISSERPMSLESFVTPQITILPGGKLSRQDAALFLGRKPQTLAHWATVGRGPPAINIGGRCFYMLDELPALRRRGGRLIDGPSCRRPVRG